MDNLPHIMTAFKMTCAQSEHDFVRVYIGPIKLTVTLSPDVRLRGNAWASVRGLIFFYAIYIFFVHSFYDSNLRQGCNPPAAHKINFIFSLFRAHLTKKSYEKEINGFQVR